MKKIYIIVLCVLGLFAISRLILGSRVTYRQNFFKIESRLGCKVINSRIEGSEQILTKTWLTKSIETNAPWYFSASFEDNVFSNKDDWVVEFHSNNDHKKYMIRFCTKTSDSMGEVGVYKLMISYDIKDGDKMIIMNNEKQIFTGTLKLYTLESSYWENIEKMLGI